MMRKIKELEGLNLRQRHEAIQLALNELSGGQKVMLRLIKLILLSPVFFIIAKVHSWWILPWLLLVFFMYPMLTKPLEVMFAKPFLQNAANKVRFEASNNDNN